jgi:hypothetical protein
LLKLILAYIYNTQEANLTYARDFKVEQTD